MSIRGEASCAVRPDAITSRPPLIETIATGDAQADVRCGDDRSYQAMAALFTAGIVRPAAWDLYSAVYRAVHDRLVPAEPINLRRMS